MWKNVNKFRLRSKIFQSINPDIFFTLLIINFIKFNSKIFKMRLKFFKILHTSDGFKFLNININNTFIL